MPVYMGLVRLTEYGEYETILPDFQKCYVLPGATIGEAIENAERALKDYVTNEWQFPLPDPQPADKLLQNPQDRWAIFVGIRLPDLRRRKRLNISVLESDLDDIDYWAGALGESRSEFLVHAAKRFMRFLLQNSGR
jgi:predicted RNase H-like HicB family nuclease